MIVTDPIADMLTRMRNALQAKHKSVSVPASKTKLAIAEVLLKEGFIASYKSEGEGINANIVIDFKLVQPKNTSSSNFLTLSGMITFVNFSQL